MGTAVADIAAGEKLAYGSAAASRGLIAVDAIPFGFKIALADIDGGESVLKYGEVIGYASRPIRRGELVHVHNLDGGRGRGDLAGQAGAKARGGSRDKESRP